MKHRLTAVLLFTSALGLGGLSLAAAPKNPDTRQVVPLNAADRHFFLSEMRAVVGGIQTILQAAARGDDKKVAATARSLGMKGAMVSEKKLRGKLPPALMEMGLPMHRAFDDLAAQGPKLKDPKLVVEKVGKIMEACNGCHMNYQVRSAL